MIPPNGGHTKLSKSIQLFTVSSRLQLYYIFSSITTLLLFSLLTICLCNINSVLSKTTQITVLVLTIIFSVTSLTTLIIAVNQSLQISTLTAKHFLQYQSIVQYVQCLPLAYISFHFFARVHFLRSTGLLDYSILATCTIYFSSKGILSQVITEIKLTKGFTQLTASKVLFSFLFRYFFFVSKMINTVLFLSTADDSVLFTVDARDLSAPRTSADQSIIESTARSHSTNILLVVVIYLVAAYIIYFIWYLNVNTRKRSSVFSLFFEPFKMLVDHSDRFFNRRLQHECISASSCETFAAKLFNFNSIKIIFYLFVNFTSQLVLAYYWYFCSMLSLSKMIQAKISLFHVLNSRTLLLNLWELEEVLKFRQFMLVSVLGSVIIATLSYHIFYQYYFKYDKSVVIEKEIQSHIGSASGHGEFCMRKESLLEKARNSSFVGDSGTLDSFSIDSFQHSSSISSISLHLNEKRDATTAVFSVPELSQYSSQMRSVDVDSLSMASTSDSRFSSSSSFFSSVDTQNEFKRIKIHRMSHRFDFDSDPESSSGVNSSATSSLSSIYHHHTYEPYSHWTTNLNLYDSNTPLHSLTLPELSSYDNGVKRPDPNSKDLNKKVADWFNKAHVFQSLGEKLYDSMSGLGRPSLSASPVASTNSNSMPVVLDSLINTDSTFKTDKSNYTCLI